MFLLGDFNARIGANHNSWPCCTGHFGNGKLNENGQRLFKLCLYHDLCISNTFFLTKPCQRVSWRPPRSCHWHQLDLVITRRPLLNCVLTTHSYHSIDCDTDHSLVGSKVLSLPQADPQLQAERMATYQHSPDISPRSLYRHLYTLCQCH